MHEGHISKDDPEIGYISREIEGDAAGLTDISRMWLQYLDGRLYGMTIWYDDIGNGWTKKTFREKTAGALGLPNSWDESILTCEGFRVEADILTTPTKKLMLNETTGWIAITDIVALNSKKLREFERNHGGQRPFKP
ncbi:MAG: hypothetical protein QOF62_2608 [Pyrinomonadaceae bacterium]|nr:hypothetical protein [Pyrinomonadaceae bacterium]